VIAKQVALTSSPLPLSTKCFETAVQAVASKVNMDTSDDVRGALADARDECFENVEESRAREESTRRSAPEEIQGSFLEIFEHNACHGGSINLYQPIPPIKTIPKTPITHTTQNFQ